MVLSYETRAEIAEFDVNNDTSLQLNSIKVPAREDVFSLVIGVGGTGVQALLETKGVINKICCLSENQKDKPTDHVAYLGIDTDQCICTQTSTVRTGEVGLDAQKEQIFLFDPSIRMLLSPEYRHRVPPYISSWLDFGIGVHGGTYGASGIRQSGRLLLFHNIDRVTQAIHSAVQEMISDHPVSHMNVYILTGLGGGTGSGTFLDLAYIAQDVVDRLVGQGKTKIYGYLFMPDVNLSRPMPQENKLLIQKNGYAALKELDYLMNMSKDGGRFTQQYTENYVIDTERAPFDFVYLVSGRGKDDLILKDPYRHCMQAVARSICSSVEKGTPKAMVMANVNAAIAQTRSPYPERSNNYLALGTWEYELPSDQILKYVTSLLFEKMDGMFTCEPTQNDVNQVRDTLGLTVGAMVPMMVGDHCDLANGNVPKWEDLFGKNARYNYRAKCDKWVDDTAVYIHQRAQNFVRNFPARFRENCEAWFTDGARGPVWVNHLIVNDKEDCRGLLVSLRQDSSRISAKVMELRNRMQYAKEAVNACAEEARKALVFLGDREGKTKAYINALNAYGDICAELVAFQELCDNVFGNCIQAVTEQNKLFDVVTEVLMALKKVCQTNANILTQANLDDSGRNFTWQPLSIPDMSPTIKKAFDASGSAQETIAKFSKALLEEARQWVENGVDVKSFIRKYLDDNMSNIANCSLETYLNDILQGTSLSPSIQRFLIPRIEQMLALQANDLAGPAFTMIGVPSNCPNIRRELANHHHGVAGGGPNMIVWTRAGNDGIFAERLFAGVPLFGYTPLAFYEEVYLETNNTHGQHLYKNWGDLPSPIPARSRDKANGYPEAIKRVEDKQRELYRECRKWPIIVKKSSARYIVYELRIADVPDLNKDFAAEKMRDERGELNTAYLEEAIRQLDTWMEQGLPGHMSTAAGTSEVYTVATLEDDESDPETVAQESLLGEYNNLRRAEKELQKYRALAQKRQELERLTQA